MRISQGAQSLPMLKAQQALEARRAGKISTPEQQQAPKAAPSAPIAKSTVDTAAPVAPKGVASQWGNTVNEIQNIARQSGFVDVSEQDIRRAYMQGESLLADYRV